MLPRHHAIVGITFSILLFLIFPEIGIFSAALTFVASVTIDFDHYLYFAFKKNNFSLKSAYIWFRSKTTKLSALSKKEIRQYYTGVYVFHGIEIVLLLFLAGKFIWNGFTFVGLGALVHLLLDWVEKFSYERVYPFKISLVFDIIGSRKLKLVE